MSHSCPALFRYFSASSASSMSEENFPLMEPTALEMAEQAKAEKSDSSSTCDAKSESLSNSDNEDRMQEDTIKQARSLLARLDDFRQSYNRTHGQVCEFFERARAVQKLGLLEPSQAAKLLSLSGDEAEDDDDGNSVADGNYADGQKTTGMKRKLRKWRKVMRQALSEICPGSGHEQQPDINPGLMKHIVDEVRNLRSQLTFQHDHIMKLAEKTEVYLRDGEEKEQFIADLLQNCKGIRFENHGGVGFGQHMTEGVNVETENEEPEQHPPLPEKLENIQFGRSKELLDTLKLDVKSFEDADTAALVVQPHDFEAGQTQRQALLNRDSALDNTLTHNVNLHDGRANSPIQTMVQRSQSRPSSRQKAAGLSHPTAVCPNHSTSGSSSNNTSGADASQRCMSNNPVGARVAAEPFKKRHFFLSIGGSMTMALLGALALNTINRKCQQ